MPYVVLANAVLLLHFAIVVFVVAGLVLVVVGNWRHWGWVNHLWFRLAHIGAIAFVVLEAWFGVTCPLTTLEAWLRAKAHRQSYSGGFVEHWVRYLLYYEAPSWAFTLAYTVFGLLVAAAWWYFPPRPRRQIHDRASGARVSTR
jgi:hypothetical protein